MNIDINTLAGQLYTAYSAGVGGVAWNGDPLPTWEEFSKDPTEEKQAKAWVSTAIEALQRSSAIMRDNFKEQMGAWKGCRSALGEIADGLESVVAAFPAGGDGGEPVDLRKIVTENCLKDMAPADDSGFVLQVRREDPEVDAPGGTDPAMQPPPRWPDINDRLALVSNVHSLYDACRAAHGGWASRGTRDKDGITCICGAIGEGSKACRALKAIKDVVVTSNSRHCEELAQILDW